MLFIFSTIFDLRCILKNQGLGRSFLRDYSVIDSSKLSILKSKDEDNRQAEAESLEVEDEISNIRHAFNVARQGFHKIPEALKAMPKMNPKGL